jgi:hypothetical protein
LASLVVFACGMCFGKSCYILLMGFHVLQITDKCLPSILNLQHLEDLALEGCFGIDDNSLAVLKNGCKSLKVLIHKFVVLFSCPFSCITYNWERWHSYNVELKDILGTKLGRIFTFMCLAVIQDAVPSFWFCSII